MARSKRLILEDSVYRGELVIDESGRRLREVVVSLN